MNLKDLLTRRSNKTASSLIVIVMIFFLIFTISFGAGYLVFLNASQKTYFSDSLKAYYAAQAGADRARFEVIKNNFDFSDNCNEDIFSDTLNNGATYSISCSEHDDGSLSFYSLGVYNKSKVALPIHCINIKEDCLETCLSGSFCGGGKLFKDGDLAVVISPSACDDNGLCDNYFYDKDNLLLAWDEADDLEFYGADDHLDGQSNLEVIQDLEIESSLSINYCANLNINNYNDWYLPAIEELVDISNSPMLPYLGFNYGLNSSPYWSSTEAGEEEGTRAYYYQIYSNENNHTDKDKNFLLRCIRKAYD